MIESFTFKTVFTASLVLASALFQSSLAAPKRRTSRPNIIFAIMDDVGVDQLKSFGYGGQFSPRTDTLDALGASGVRFRNTWSMPECSPSRAAFFTGRFPLRNKIYGAIGPKDLANSQVSPYETTVPKVLKTRGYTSGLFGKFHLAGPENNPFGNGGPASVGFDYFYGFVGGLPGSVDTTAGGVAPLGTYSCGFVTDATEGACRFSSGRCDEGLGGDTPGKTCLERGGIFVPNTTCTAARALPVSFTSQNAYYVSPIVINRSNGKISEVSLANPRARKYRTTLEVDATRDWINERRKGSRWMATVSFSADHTPLQCPPDTLLSEGSRQGNNSVNCASTPQQRSISDRMIEAMDTEFGRLLRQTGLARRSKTGALTLTKKGKKTMIVVAGDNGSFGPTAQLPFDPTRAKGTVYQTGVWVPLLVSGPLVVGGDRNVEHMVNIVDVFELFGEIAGADVHKVVKRPIDSQSLLPYLQNPNQGAIRSVNFTQSAANIQAEPFGNPPCILGTSCSQTPISKGVCEDNGGVWWGPGATDPSTAGIGPSGLRNCCEVNEFLTNSNKKTYAVLPSGTATRNEKYKLVRNVALDYDPNAKACVEREIQEFYEINQAPATPKIDRQGTALPLNALTPEQQSSFETLSASMDSILASQPACPGDGNLDGKVDRKDVKGWERFVKLTKKNLDMDPNFTSSVFDFNLDGQTDTADLDIINANLGTTCF